MKSGFLLQMAIGAVVAIGANPEVCAQTPKVDSGFKTKSVKKITHRKLAKSTVKSKLPDKRTREPKITEIKTVPEGAIRLLAAIQFGKLTLTNGNRDKEQLKTLAISGSYLWPAPNPPRLVSKKPTSNARKLPIAPLFDDKLQENPLEIQPSSTSVPTDAFQAEEESGKRLKRGVSPSRHAPVGMRDGRFGKAKSLPPDSFVAESPLYVACSPSIGLLKMLAAFSAHSSVAKPLELMSLLRPPYRTSRFAHAGPRNPHSCGLAADIAAYGGLRIRQSQPEECVHAFIKMMDDLPIGKYRVGAPKSPDKMIGQESFSRFLADALPAENASAPLTEAKKKTRKKSKTSPAVSKTMKPDAPKLIVISMLRGAYDGSPAVVWPFFPAPRRETVSDSNGNNSTRTLFANESYAPETALASGRVRAALARARRRGADVVALFPDAADHVHIDVRDH